MKRTLVCLFSILVGSVGATGVRAADTAVDVIDLSGMSASAGFTLKSDVAGDAFAQTISIIGDVNADGFDDVLIGAPASNSSSVQGAAYVVFGHGGQFSAEFDVGTLNGSNGFKLTTAAAGGWLGRSASGLGDINADGIDDFAVAAPRAAVGGNGSPVLYSAGKIFVVFGHVGAFPALLDVDSLNGSNGFRVDAANEDTGTGYALDSAGDFNGDGQPDLLIGSHGESTLGDAWIVLGNTSGFPPVLSLATLPSSGNGFRLIGSGSNECGRAVAGIGDINADGKDDVIVGAPATMVDGMSNAGRSYVVFGRETTPGGNALLLDSLTTSGVLRFDGTMPGDASGSSLAGVGDINDDGVRDFIIGTPRRGGYVGGAYVVFGGATLASMSLDAVVSAGHGLELGLPFGYNTNAGAAVSAAGDVNADGIADFMIAIPGGLPMADVNREVAVLFGRNAANPWPAYVDLASFAEGMRLESTSQVSFHSIGDLRGYVDLAGAGDINGDGVADMLVGSPRALAASEPGTWLGRGYAVFGRSGPLPDLIFRDGFEASP